MHLGAQLYTVRQYTQDKDSFSDTLKKIADIGYRSVQVSGTCAYDADWLSEQLKKNGLICPVTHTNPDRIADDTLNVIKEHKQFGCGVVGIGCAPGRFLGGFSDYQAFRDRYLPAARTLKEAGIILGYHNHYFEFERFHGCILLEHMKSDFSAEELSFILDTYWVQYSGGDPAEWIQKLTGRIKCLHLKDMAIVGDKQRMAVIGEGNINFENVLQACSDTGIQHFLVEQDECYGKNPFDCLKRSFQNLKSMGLS